MQLILCKDNANERNENLFSNCRVQPIFCKDKYKNDNQQVFANKSFIRNEHFSQNRSFVMNTFRKIIHSQ